MPGWQGSDRRERLPPNWRTLRRQAAQRAGWRCQGIVQGFRCPNEGRHCDHIRPGDDHSLSNLQWLCPDCHNSKSGREGAQARPSLYRDREAHPGLRPTPPAQARAVPPPVFLPPGR